MGVRTNRRRFLGGLAASGLVAGGWNTSARATSARGFELTTLAPGIQLIAGPGGNSLAIDTAEGIALVDGGLKADSRELLRLVQQGGRRVALLFNTHWHPHATGCNEALGKAGVRIVAQENTRLWLQRPIVKVLENERHPALPKVAWPTESFDEQQEYQLGGTKLECGQLFQAHTDGDLYVRVPAANLIVAGGTVGVGRYPVSDSFTGGWIRGMLNATRTLIGLCDADTRIVAERGAVVDKAHLEAQAQMLETLTERLWQMMRKGLSEEDLVAARPTQDYDARWGEPRDFVIHAYRGIWGHVREMRGIV